MEAWQATVQDEAGNAVFNPQITVYEPDGVTLADIFNEDGSPKENPFTGTTEGFAQFWAGSGTYKIRGANGGQTELWENDLGIAKEALSIAVVSAAAYDDRDDFVSAAAAGLERGAAFADGVGYRPQNGVSLPSLNNWRPLDDTLDIRHVGSTSEIESDFPGLFQQAAVDATANGWTLNVSQKGDRSPYVYGFIQHILTGDLRVNFEQGAVLLPDTNHQAFTTGGSAGPFTITAFVYSEAQNGRLSAMLVNPDGSETKLTQGTHFNVSGQNVTLTSAPDAGSILVVSTNRYAMHFRSTIGSGRRVDVTGELNIDLNRSGYIISSASGSGLGITNVDHWTVERLRVWSDAGYGAAPVNKRADTAFVPLAFKSGRIEHIDARGMNDLALYVSGSGSPGHDDDAGGLQVGSIYAERCGVAAKLSRQAEHAYIGSINCADCHTGFLIGTTDDGLQTGGGIHIGSINAVRMSRRVLDVRDVVQGGIHVGSISVRDIGYLPGGVVPVAEAPAAIFMSAAKSLQVDYLDVRWRDWTPPAGFPAIRVSGASNYGNRVLGGWIEGAPIGIREPGGPVNHIGNSFTLTMKDVPTPIDSVGEVQADYDLTLLTETAGVVTQKRVNSLFSERKTGTPTVLLPGATSSPTYSYTVQDLSYRRMLDATHFVLSLQAQITHSESTPRQLRIYLPDDLTTTFAAAVPVTLGRMQGGINLPANDGVFAEVAPGNNYVRFYYRPTGSAPVEVNSSHITSGVNLRIEVSGLIPV